MADHAPALVMNEKTPAPELRPQNQSPLPR